MGRRSKKKKPLDTGDMQRPVEAAGPAASPPPGPPSRKTRRLHGWRGWLLRLSLFVLAPVLCFGLLEAGLRLGGYGYPTGFFLGPDASGTCTTNYRFGWRFFPRPLARDPHPCILSAKPAGSIRIFVLGSSAAMGTPDPAFSFGRILGVMLREQYPGVQFEVINGAMTAINSYVSREIVRDCAAREPNLFVVYLGNNEVVGPYGPGTVFQNWSPSLRMIRSSLWVKSTRVGELLGDIVGYFHGSQDTSAHWRGMEMFLNNPVAADDPRMPAVYDNYRRNLTDICGIARRAGAAVVLSTVAVNLRDCPPFASLHRPGLTPEDLAKWESIYKAGGELETSNRWPEALQQYEVAAKIDDRFAELQFRLGNCLLHASRLAEARERFELARDLDVLRFRADSRINAIIREVAAEQEAAGVRFVDAEQVLECGGLPPLSNTADSEPKSSPRVLESGSKPPHSKENLFYEHVHLTFDGNYLLARTVLDQVCAALSQRTDLGKPGAIPSREQCAELLALTSWDEYRLAAQMVAITSREPFTNQLNYSLRQAAALKWRDDLRRQASTPQAMQAAWRTYEAALAKAPSNWSLHQHFAKLAMQQRRPDVAVEHLRIAVQKLPWDISIHNDLGNVLTGQGRMDEAIAHYQKALEIGPDNPEVHSNLGTALARRGKVDEAITQYQKALEIEPDLAETHDNLGSVLAGSGRGDEAIVHFQKALEIKPDDLNARQNLDMARSNQKNMLTVLAQRREILRSRPKDAALMNDTAWLLATNPNASVRNGPEAVGLAQRAIELSDVEIPEFFGTLAAAYAETGQFAEAVQTARKAVDIATQKNKPALAESTRARIRLYEARLPFRDSPSSQ
ncbi:MAG: tetratricopeptide repeat protein [Planctomycetota bacterium]